MEFIIKIITVYCMYLIVKPIILTFKIVGEISKTLYTLYKIK